MSVKATESGRNRAEKNLITAQGEERDLTEWFYELVVWGTAGQNVVPPSKHIRVSSA